MLSLTLQVDGPADLVVTLHDGFDQRIDAVTGPGAHVYNVAQGIYIVRTELAGISEDLPVRLVASRVVSISPPRVVDAAPVRSSVLVSEPYGEAARRLSREYELATVEGKRGALIVFERDVRGASSKPPNVARWHGESIAVERRADSSSTWRASLARGEGAFVLQDDESGTELSVHIYPGWTTMVFLRDVERRRLNDATVLLCRPDLPFDADDPEQNAIVRAKRALRDGRPAEGDFLERLRAGRFGNPMLGLVGAHVLLSRGEHDPLPTIVDLLRDAIGDVPDVRIIRMAFSRTTGGGLTSYDAHGPPMLSYGFDALMRIQDTDGSAVGDTIGIDWIAQFRIGSGPCLTWEARWSALDRAWPRRVPERFHEMALEAFPGSDYGFTGPAPGIAPWVWNAVGEELHRRQSSFDEQGLEAFSRALRLQRKLLRHILHLFIADFVQRTAELEDGGRGGPWYGRMPAPQRRVRVEPDLLQSFLEKALSSPRSKEVLALFHPARWGEPSMTSARAPVSWLDDLTSGLAAVVEEKRIPELANHLGTFPEGDPLRGAGDDMMRHWLGPMFPRPCQYAVPAGVASKQLANMFDQKDRIRALVARSGVDPTDVDFDDKPRWIWMSVLDRARTQGRMDHLLTVLCLEYPVDELRHLRRVGIE